MEEWFLNYRGNNFVYDNPVGSFYSLLSSNGIEFVNPLGEEKPNMFDQKHFEIEKQ